MGRRDSRRNRRRKGPPPQGGGQGVPPEATGVPMCPLLAIPRNAGLAGWVAAAALTTDEVFREDIDPEADICQLAVGPNWRLGLPQPPEEERAAFAAKTVEDFERTEGYLFLGVGDGSGSFGSASVETCLEQVLDSMGMPFPGIGKLLEGDPSCRVERYPRVASTPAMAVQALWRLVAAGLLPHFEAEEACRGLGAVLLEAIRLGQLRSPADATLPALVAMRYARRQKWPLGKAMLRAMLATDGWLNLAAYDWNRRGRLLLIGIVDGQGVQRMVRMGCCRTKSPLFTTWARGAVEADILVRIEDGGFFAQVVGSKPSVQGCLRSAAGIWRRALLTRRASAEEESAASSPGHLSWSPIHLDPQGACAGNRHESDPHLAALPFAAQELEERLCRALEFT